MLLGWKTDTTGAVSPGSTQQLITVPPSQLSDPHASTTGTLTVNLPSNSSPINTPPATGQTAPSTNTAGSYFNEKTQLTAYEADGTAVPLDVYLTNMGPDPTTGDPTWEVDVFDSRCATNGGFPYVANSKDPTPQLTNATTPPALTFDPNTGTYTGGSPVNLTLTLPAGTNPSTQPLTLDMSATTQWNTADFTTSLAQFDGNAPSALSSLSIGSDGVLSAVYQDGTKVPKYLIKLATVPSPDNMTVLTGNVFETSAPIASDPSALVSGSPSYYAPGTQGLGTIASSSLESSTVDLASELATMIAAQNNYQANSKVFETGSKLLQVLINLQQ